MGTRERLVQLWLPMTGVIIQGQAVPGFHVLAQARDGRLSCAPLGTVGTDGEQWADAGVVGVSQGNQLAQAVQDAWAAHWDS